MSLRCHLDRKPGFSSTSSSRAHYFSTLKYTKLELKNENQGFLPKDDTGEPTSEPPKLPEGGQRTWILEVDCFPLLRPGNVERSVTEGGVHMVWKGGGWINCMMEKSPASALTSASKC